MLVLLAANELTYLQSPPIRIDAYREPLHSNEQNLPPLNWVIGGCPRTMNFPDEHKSSNAKSPGDIIRVAINSIEASHE
jgi:hypothetical protein